MEESGDGSMKITEDILEGGSSEGNSKSKETKSKSEKESEEGSIKIKTQIKESIAGSMDSEDIQEGSLDDSNGRSKKKKTKNKASNKQSTKIKIKESGDGSMKITEDIQEGDSDNGRSKKMKTKNKASNKGSITMIIEESGADSTKILEGTGDVPIYSYNDDGHGDFSGKKSKNNGEDRDDKANVAIAVSKIEKGKDVYETLNDLLASHKQKELKIGLDNNNSDGKSGKKKPEKGKNVGESKRDKARIAIAVREIEKGGDVQRTLNEMLGSKKGGLFDFMEGGRGSRDRCYLLICRHLCMICMRAC
jgi:hypothetical protein